MSFSGMLHRVALVGTDMLEERHLQDPHGVTCQKTAFSITSLFFPILENLNELIMLHDASSERKI
jgi:hypothetical protein